jgi:hypothetical protein
MATRTVRVRDRRQNGGKPTAHVYVYHIESQKVKEKSIHSGNREPERAAQPFDPAFVVFTLPLGIVIIPIPRRMVEVGKWKKPRSKESSTTC